MSQYDRPPKKKPQRPDDFISLMDHIVRYFEAHQNKFYLLIVAVIVAFSGYGIYQYLLGKKLNTIAVDYSRADLKPPYPTDPAAYANGACPPDDPSVEGVMICDTDFPQRWQVINASRARYLKFKVPGQPLVRIGGDDGLIAKPLSIASPRRSCQC